MAKNQWILKIADRVEHFANRKGKDKIICASGISPSGVIHLGNLREIFSVHLIVQELKSRNRSVEHLHFWDDYDRIRKIPQEISESFSQYIGMPLSSVPDPFGHHASYADHFKSKFESKLSQLGIFPTYISQSEAYSEGKYNEPVRDALNNRLAIFDILANYIKEENREEFIKDRASYYPFKVYCGQCKTDNTTMRNYNAESDMISYKCDNCGHEEEYSLAEKVSGKLVWKVDWPMRWKFYDIDYEPGGVDHSTPGSSFTVGKEIISKVMEASPPYYSGYAFVGLTGGAAKISSSAGSIATPENALKILEPAILRWLYIRTDMSKSFNINFDKQIFQLYDEWDNLVTKNEAGTASEQQMLIYNKCIHSGASEIDYSKIRIPFRMLCSAIEITSDNKAEVARIISEQTGENYTESNLIHELAIRYERAYNWVEDFQPQEEKLQIRDSFDADYFKQLEDHLKLGLKNLTEQMAGNWTLADLSTLIYKIPKDLIGHPYDAKPTDELRKLQRSFFVAIYNLILNEDTGPRLPTLFISLGKEKISKLLGSDAV